MSNVTNAGSVTWQNYLDLENDLKPHLQIVSIDETVDTKLQGFLDMACQWAQGYIGRPVAPTTFDRRFNGWTGWNGAYIELPYYPILEVGSVVEWWGISGPHVLVEQTPANQSSQDSFQCDYLRGQLIRTFPGLVQRPWFPGSRNIEVVWTAGYNPIPADIRMATLEYAAHWWRNTQQAARTNVRAGGDDADIVAAGLWQGTPARLSALLSPYVQIGIG